MARKEIRQQQLVAIILEEGRIPSTDELAEKLEVTPRTIRRDLEDIARLIPSTAVEDIEQRLMLKLRERVPEMSDSDLIKLAEFFLAKRSRIDTQIEGRVEVKKEIDMKEALSEYAPVIAKLIHEMERGPAGKTGPGEADAEQTRPIRTEGTADAGPVGEVRLSAQDEAADVGDSPLPECPRCGGAPTFDRSLGEWVCSSCSSPLRLLAGRAA